VFLCFCHHCFIRLLSSLRAGFSRQSSPDSAAGRRFGFVYHSRSRFSGALLYSRIAAGSGFVLGAIVSPPDAIAAMAIAAHSACLIGSSAFSKAKAL